MMRETSEHKNLGVSHPKNRSEVKKMKDFFS